MGQLIDKPSLDELEAFDDEHDMYIKREKDLYLPEWGQRGKGTFVLATRTTEMLPPGVYQVAQDRDNRVFFKENKVITDDLILFPNSVIEELRDTIQLFWKSKANYKKYKQVYKRGILLHGKQGCGKTSSLNLLFSDLLKNQNGIVIIVSNPILALEAMRQLREVEPDRPLIALYEDLDSIIDEHKEHTVLALLDGEFQTDNIVHLATTNYLEKIPNRLKNRPSRLDEIIELGLPSLEHRKLYIEHLFKSIGKEIPTTIYDDTTNFTFAHIKELVISVYLLKKEYPKVLARLKEMNSGEKVGFAAAKGK